MLVILSQSVPILLEATCVLVLLGTQAVELCVTVRNYQLQHVNA